MNKELIDNLVRDSGLRKKDLAAYLGITPQQLCKLQNGESFTSLAVLTRIYAISKGQITPNDLYLPAIQKALEASPEKCIINDPKKTAQQEAQDGR